MRLTAKITLIFSSLFFFHYIINLVLTITKPPLLLHSSSSNTSITTPAFSLLIGILTRPDNYDRRHFLRLVYGIQHYPPFTQIDIKFIFCTLSKPEQKVRIALEILRYNDIIILNCTENMNKGKTFTYFSSLPKILPKPYTYIMKADDDVFIQLNQLSLSLLPLPRFDLYYGFVIPCSSKNPYVEYMSGMGFVLSWDIVEWIENSEIPGKEREGPEDKVVGKWLKMGKKGMNRYSDKPAMYDYPGSNGKCSHELIKETVAVHRLKKWDQWIHVLEFFNVTKRLQDSKLYHL